jgi:hypothetical protein
MGANHLEIRLLMASPKADRPCENESPMTAAIPERRPTTEEISGLIERVTFHNDESGFCVLRVKAPGGAGVLSVERASEGHAPKLKRPGTFVIFR